MGHIAKLLNDEPIEDEWIFPVLCALGFSSPLAKGRELYRSARSESGLERVAAAMHPTASRKVLELLAKDRQLVIRDHASKRLRERLVTSSQVDE